MHSQLPSIREEPTTENARAAWWRQRIMRLQPRELAELTGYTPQTIKLMEAGINSKGQRVVPWVWQRYKMACAAAHAWRFGWPAGALFDWNENETAGSSSPHPPLDPAGAG